MVKNNFEIILVEKLCVNKIFLGATMKILCLPPNINPASFIETFDHPEALNAIVDPLNKNETFIFLKENETLIKQFLKATPAINKQILGKREMKEHTEIESVIKKYMPAMVNNAILEFFENIDEETEQFLHHINEKPQYWN